MALAESWKQSSGNSKGDLDWDCRVQGTLALSKQDAQCIEEECGKLLVVGGSLKACFNLVISSFPQFHFSLTCKVTCVHVRAGVHPRPIYHRANSLKQSFTLTSMASWPNPHVFEPWKETRVPGWHPHRIRKYMQTLHKKVSLQVQTSLLLGDTNTNMLPAHLL